MTQEKTKVQEKLFFFFNGQIKTFCEKKNCDQNKYSARKTIHGNKICVRNNMFKKCAKNIVRKHLRPKFD